MCNFIALTWQYAPFPYKFFFNVKFGFFSHFKNYYVFCQIKIFDMRCKQTKTKQKS